MITNLRIGIYNKLKTLFSNRFYFLEAPGDSLYPYAVYSQLPDSYDLDSENEFIKAYIQINIYGKVLTEIEALEEQLISLLNQKPNDLQVSGYFVIDIDLIFSRTTKLDVTPEGVYLITHQYQIHLQKGD